MSSNILLLFEPVFSPFSLQPFFSLRISLQIANFFAEFFGLSRFQIFGGIITFFGVLCFKSGRMDEFKSKFCFHASPLCTTPFHNIPNSREDLKTVRRQRHRGSNPLLSAEKWTCAEGAGSFFINGIRTGAVVNDMPGACQSRERPIRSHPMIDQTLHHTEFKYRHSFFMEEFTDFE